MDSHKLKIWDFNVSTCQNDLVDRYNQSAAAGTNVDGHFTTIHSPSKMLDSSTTGNDDGSAVPPNSDLEDLINLPDASLFPPTQSTKMMPGILTPPPSSSSHGSSSPSSPTLPVVTAPVRTPMMRASKMNSILKMQDYAKYYYHHPYTARRAQTQNSRIKKQRVKNDEHKSNDNDATTTTTNITTITTTTTTTTNNNEAVRKSVIVDSPQLTKYATKLRANLQISKIYDTYFKRERSIYKSFDAIGGSDVAYLIGIFKGFDAVNSPSFPRYPLNSNVQKVGIVEYCIVSQYIEAPEFNETLLTDTKHDHVVNAIISYFLTWRTSNLKEYSNMYARHQNFVNAIIEARQYEHGQYVYCYRGAPFVKNAHKLLRAHFRLETLPRNTFEWTSRFNQKFYEHMKQVYDLIKTDGFTYDTIKMLEADMEIPYDLPNVNMSKLLKLRDEKTAFKFITGQACCCKTTILNRLRELGWNKYSRGDVGSFSGKSSNPAAIGNLHAALDFALTRSNVIGDRGYIDNVLWSYIMPACDPVFKDTMLHKLYNFLNSNFNEAAIAHYLSQKGLIFIDPYVELNRARQLKRSEAGDAHRARIHCYPITQFIVYYAAARLFGWKVICVPYDKEKKFDEVQYQKNIEIVSDYFGEPIDDDIIKPNVTRFDKPSNSYNFDNSYPKAAGIYK